MTDSDFADLANALLPGVLAAGRIEMAYYNSTVVVERKADKSPVTLADREAEKVLLEVLAKAAPGVPVVAEEAAAAGQIPSIERRFFLVDPLDGTREFINKRGDFTINIGLIEDGTPQFGIVYAPALGVLYVTLAKDKAVVANVNPDANPSVLADCHPREIRTRTPDPTALTALASRSHRSAATDEFLAKYTIADTRSAGSSLKFCLVATGEADLYPRIGETSEWDTAAAHAVLTAAGGTVTTLDGEPLIYGKADRDFLNPHFVAWGKAPIPPAAGKIQP